MKKKNQLSAHTRIWEQVSHEFERQNFSPKKSKKHWQSASRFLVLGLFLMSIVVPSQNTVDTASAGQILPMFGPIELIRDNQSTLVHEGLELKVGDRIKLGHRSRAVWVTPGQSQTHFDPSTEFFIDGKNQITLKRGNLNRVGHETVRIETERASVKTTPGANLNISVNETGETEVRALDSEVLVKDNFGRPLILNDGEVATVYSDGINQRVNSQVLTNNVKLSSQQIRLLRSKIDVARTKLLTGVSEQIQNGSSELGIHLVSSEKTLKSLSQIIHSSRDLRPTKHVSRADVTLEKVKWDLTDKGAPDFLMREFSDVVALKKLLANQSDLIAFGPSITQISFYDRYVLLEKLKLIAETEEQVLSLDRIQQIYVRHFWRDVQSSEFQVAQRLRLAERLAQIPDSDFKNHFVNDFMNLVTADQIDYLFTS